MKTDGVSLSFEIDKFNDQAEQGGLASLKSKESAVCKVPSKHRGLDVAHPAKEISGRTLLRSLGSK